MIEIAAIHKPMRAALYIHLRAIRLGAATRRCHSAPNQVHGPERLGADPALVRGISQLVKAAGIGSGSGV